MRIKENHEKKNAEICFDCDLFLTNSKCRMYSPSTSLLTTMLQLYIGVTIRCGWFWNALRQHSFTEVMS